MTPLSHKIAVLVFLENTAGDQLLMLRAKPPNLGVWSPIGGKLETGIGESPFECAVRETREETGFALTPSDLHLFAMIAEKAYEGQSHWLLFLFSRPAADPGPAARHQRGSLRLFFPESHRRPAYPGHRPDRALANLRPISGAIRCAARRLRTRTAVTGGDRTDHAGLKVGTGGRSLPACQPIHA